MLQKAGNPMVAYLVNKFPAFDRTQQINAYLQQPDYGSYLSQMIPLHRHILFLSNTMAYRPPALP